MEKASFKNYIKDYFNVIVTKEDVQKFINTLKR